MLTPAPACISSAQSALPNSRQAADSAAQLKFVVGDHVVTTTHAIVKAGRVIVQLLDVEQTDRPCVVPPLDVPLAEADEELLWDTNAGAIDVRGRRHLQLWIGNSRGCVDGSCHEVDAAPERSVGFVAVPLRWLGEALGWSVTWLAGSQTALITLAPARESPRESPTQPPGSFGLGIWTAIVASVLGLFSIGLGAIGIARRTGARAESATADDQPTAQLFLPAAIAVAIGIAALSIAFIKLLDPAITGDKLADLLKALVWPIFVVACAIAFAPSIALILDRIKSGEFSAGDALKIKFDTQAAEAADNLYAAVRARGLGGIRTSAKQEFASIRALLDRQTQRVFGTSRILWVDDKPTGNRLEIGAFQALGIVVETVTSTAEALEKLTATAAWDVVISNMKRPPDDKAGFALADQMRQRGLGTPIVIYTGSPQWLNSIRAEALSHDIAFVTIDPRELFTAVINVLLDRKGM